MNRLTANYACLNTYQDSDDAVVFDVLEPSTGLTYEHARNAIERYCSDKAVFTYRYTQLQRCQAQCGNWILLSVVVLMGISFGGLTVATIEDSPLSVHLTVAAVALAIFVAISVGASKGIGKCIEVVKLRAIERTTRNLMQEFDCEGVIQQAHLLILWEHFTPEHKKLLDWDQFYECFLFLPESKFNTIAQTNTQQRFLEAFRSIVLHTNKEVIRSYFENNNLAFIRLLSEFPALRRALERVYSQDDDDAELLARIRAFEIPEYAPVPTRSPSPIEEASEQSEAASSSESVSVFHGDSTIDIIGSDGETIIGVNREFLKKHSSLKLLTESPQEEKTFQLFDTTAAEFNNLLEIAENPSSLITFENVIDIHVLASKYMFEGLLAECFVCYSANLSRVNPQVIEEMRLLAPLWNTPRELALNEIILRNFSDYFIFSKQIDETFQKAEAFAQVSKNKFLVSSLKSTLRGRLMNSAVNDSIPRHYSFFYKACQSIDPSDTKFYENHFADKIREELKIQFLSLWDYAERGEDVLLMEKIAELSKEKEVENRMKLEVMMHGRVVQPAMLQRLRGVRCLV